LRGVRGDPCGMRDEDFIALMQEYGITPTVLMNILLVFTLFAMVALNVYLYKQFRKNSKARAAAEETVMDWNQSLAEIEIDFPLPKRLTRADVICKITSSHIRFGFRDEDPMLDGTLYKRVVSDDCTWQFWPVGPEPTHIKMTLVKASEGNWKTLLSNDATGRLLTEADEAKAAAGGGGLMSSLSSVFGGGKKATATKTKSKKA